MKQPTDDGSEVARSCPFCAAEPSRIVMRNEHALALEDAFPVSEGHTLVIPKRHCRSFFDLPPDEQQACWKLVAKMRSELAGRGFSAFNIGINDGADAGQTILHAHIHVIPRSAGDVPDPRGGIRWVIPQEVACWDDSEQPPSAERQVEFLRYIQRILSEGRFSSTYKLALLHSLADLSVLNGTETSCELEISTRAVARQFVRLYWAQAYPAFDNGHSLKQNNSQQAKVVRLLRNARAKYQTLYSLMQSNRDWDALIKEIDATIRGYPIKHLQVLQGDRVEFLYEIPAKTSQKAITLRSGIAYCFRAFHGLVTELCRTVWIQQIRHFNRNSEEHLGNLRKRMFDAQRQDLTCVRPHLVQVQGGCCFYCQQPISGEPEVEHFVPWSAMAVDLIENLVVAHRSCNNSKDNYLAAPEHLARWLERNDQHKKRLEEIALECGVVSNRLACDSIARWAYSRAESWHTKMWSDKDSFAEGDAGWKASLVPKDTG